MFKLRRRAVAATTGSDLPLCSMCGQNIRVDAASGRCALGHRVSAPAFAAAPVTDDATAVLEPVAFEETTALPAVEEPAFVTESLPVYDGEPAGGYAGEGLYEAYQSADAAAGHSVTWDDVVAPAESGIVYDDYMAWNEPVNSFSSLDVDPDALPVAADEVADEAPVASTTTPVSSDLLDELDDAAYARRRAVGTIGATIGVTGAVFAAVAMLPF